MQSLIWMGKVLIETLQSFIMLFFIENFICEHSFKYLWDDFF